MDDGGRVSINGTQVYSVAPTCSIKNNQIEVTNMPAGQSSRIDVTAINSGLAGVGADVDFYFYSTGGSTVGPTPVVTAPSCSNSSYSATISWAPVSGNVRVFIDDNLSTPDAFDKIVSGAAGSTPAPEGFNQRIPGAPQVLTFDPGKTYYTFIHKGDTQGPTVSWRVNTCEPAGEPDLTAGPVTPTTLPSNTPASIFASAINQGTASTGSSFMNIFQVTPNPDNWGAIVNLSPASSPAIDKGASGTVSTTHTFSEGIHFARLCVDKAGVGDSGSITESNEDNNCGEWTRIEAKPDVVDTCTNGATNYPICGCTNGATNYPACNTVPGGTCPNGATNYPTCTTGGGGGCINGAVNPPTCSNFCTNGATNYPSCTTGPGGSCINRAVNPTLCTLGGNGKCLNGASNPPTCNVDIGGFRTLKVNRAGGGEVTSTDGAIICGGSNTACSRVYEDETNVEINVRTTSGYWRFTGWTTSPSGLCSDSSTSCSLIMSRSITVTPVFAPRIFDYREF